MIQKKLDLFELVSRKIKLKKVSYDSIENLMKIKNMRIEMLKFKKYQLRNYRAKISQKFYELVKPIGEAFDLLEVGKMTLKRAAEITRIHEELIFRCFRSNNRFLTIVEMKNCFKLFEI